MVENAEVALGKMRLFEELGIDVSALQTQAEALRQEGQTVMLVAINQPTAGLLGVADPKPLPKRFGLCIRMVCNWSC